MIAPRVLVIWLQELILFMFNHLGEVRDVSKFLFDRVLGVLGIEDNPRFSLQPSKLREHGDYAFNAAMIIAKQERLSPVKLAGEFVEKISELEFVEKCETAGPGFVNIFLTKAFVLYVFGFIDKDYGVKNVGKGRAVNVEFVSANPTGPLHIGHIRGAIYGDVLSRLLTIVGFQVTREYYVNDAGSQIDVLLRSVMVRYRQILGEDVELEEACYPGEYLIDCARRMRDRFGGDVPEPEEVRGFVLQEMLTGIRDDLGRIGVRHDVFSSEQDIVFSGGVESALETLDGRGLLYTGTLPIPSGVAISDWEAREQLIFRSKEFGDDRDRSVKRHDGTNTYFASDIAYHANKLERGFGDLVVVLGADHSGYVRRLVSATKALALSRDEEVDIDVRICQLVNFLQNGTPVRMSKRKGTFSTLRDVLEGVSPDVLRLMMLTKRSDVVINFDFEVVKSETKDSPFFYIQYAYSRISSILRKVEGLELESSPNLHLLQDEYEMLLVRKALLFPRLLCALPKSHDLHLLVEYIYDLSAVLHSYWSAGKVNEGLRVVNDDLELTSARVYVLKKVLHILLLCFSIIGIEPFDSM